MGADFFWTSNEEEVVAVGDKISKFDPGLDRHRASPSIIESGL